MSNEHGDRDRQVVLASNICGLFYDLGPSTYDEIAPKIEWWIEYVLDERFMKTNDLVERVSPVAWKSARSSHSHISRFLKEFREASHRSEQARSFVDELCIYLLRWFAVASAEDLWVNWRNGTASENGGPGFISAASFMGHLIERGLLAREPVRRHIFKPLTNHYYNKDNHSKQAIRANAIYELFTAAGNTLLQGFLESEEVQDCFKKLEIWVLLGKISEMDTLEAARLNELREIRTAWLQRRIEEGPRGTTATEVPVKTPVAPAPRDLPSARIGADDHPSALQDIEPLSLFQGVGFYSDAYTGPTVSKISSPTLSISTVSDLTSTELGEDTGEDGEKFIPSRHETFYLEDGNVEIVCGHTIFRVHSPVISFSSLDLRSVLSTALLNATTSEGCPRVFFKDSAEDFAVLLKMIYTPGFPAKHKVPEFTMFASLLRMATKYDFSDVREGLIEDLKGAYPAKWEEFEAAKVLGEDVFGSPKPHPNAVLNLLLEQRVKFALPFAAYRAARAGFPSLISDEPGTKLPRLTLASTIYGMERIRHVMVQLSHSIVYSGNLKVCTQKECVLNVGMDPTERRMEALKKVFGIMVNKAKDEILSPLSLGDVACVNCAKLLEDAHLRHCEQFVWRALPSLLVVGGSREGS